jgi:predicted kinase
VLHLVAGARLRAGRLTVVDATNVLPYARAGLFRLAAEYGVPAVAIVLDVPEPVCWERSRARTDRTIGRRALKAQYGDLRRSLDRLGQEGFQQVHVLSGADEVDAAAVAEVT